MPFSIPNSKKLKTERLSSVFNNTTASYKFYWFISIIQILTNNDNSTKIPVKNILTQLEKIGL